MQMLDLGSARCPSCRKHIRNSGIFEPNFALMSIIEHMRADETEVRRVDKSCIRFKRDLDSCMTTGGYGMTYRGEP